MKQLCFAILCLCLLECSLLGEDQLFVAKPLTKPKQFTPGIEGPACDAAGNIYAVNFERQQTMPVHAAERQAYQRATTQIKPALELKDKQGDKAKEQDKDKEKDKDQPESRQSILAKEPVNGPHPYSGI